MIKMTWILHAHSENKQLLFWLLQHSSDNSRQMYMYQVSRISPSLLSATNQRYCGTIIPLQCISRCYTDREPCTLCMLSHRLPCTATDSVSVQRLQTDWWQQFQWKSAGSRAWVQHACCYYKVHLWCMYPCVLSHTHTHTHSLTAPKVQKDVTLLHLGVFDHFSHKIKWSLPIHLQPQNSHNSS